MTSNKKRMTEISFWALPPRDNKNYDRIIRELKKRETPEVKKQVKNAIKKAQLQIEVQQLNGFGFSADSILREYNLEYNYRVMNGSPHDLPSSFNVVEAFNKFLPSYATFSILEEIDHIFSFDEFIDYITSGDFNSTEISTLEQISDGQIYSYNSISDPREIIFSTTNNKNYGFSSISFIKFDNEVSIILVAGQECDIEEKTEKVKKSMSNPVTFRHRNHIKPSNDYELGPVILSESHPLLRCIVLARIDLATQTFDARYVNEDWGQSYQVISDDVTAFLDSNGRFIHKEAEEIFNKMPEALNEHEALFELCKTCLFLPNYFESFSDDVTVERHPTEYKNFKNKVKNKKSVSLLNTAYKIAYRQPYVLLRETRKSPDRVGFITPEIQIETSGYWKKLPIQSQGVGKNGQPITGRTWVTKTLSWCSNENNTVLSINRKTQNVDLENAGYIYVMRSAAHQKDIFKIGLTKRDSESRAKELSYSTSSPDQFLIVEEWHVGDCVLAERLIHGEFNP